MDAYERNKAFRRWKVRKSRLERLGQLTNDAKQELIEEIRPLVEWAFQPSESYIPPEKVQIQGEYNRLTGRY